MARNKIQYQKGISIKEFLGKYGTEEQCYEALFKWRWGKGFVCRRCGHKYVHQPQAPGLPVSQMSFSDEPYSRNDISFKQAFTDNVVSGHISYDPEQEWGIDHGTVPAAWDK